MLRSLEQLLANGRMYDFSVIRTQGLEIITPRVGNSRRIGEEFLVEGLNCIGIAAVQWGRGILFLERIAHYPTGSQNGWLV